MSSSDPGFDKQKLHELAAAVTDGNANENQLRELTEILRVDPSARDEYLALVDLHAILATELMSGASSERRDGMLPPATAPLSGDDGRWEPLRQGNAALQPFSVPNHRWIPSAIAAALGACLLVAVILSFPIDPPFENDSFVTVAQATEAVWESDEVDIGSRFGPATMRLKSGLARLEFDSGVEVTLEGPAEFRLIDIAKTELKSGLLTAWVPPGAEGFTVDTPAAQVIDLGTSFGIDLTTVGFSNVSVFDGEVEVAPLDSNERETAERHLLFEGESIRIGTGYEIEDVNFDGKPFQKMWPFASGIVGSTETISFVPPWPRRIRLVKSDEQIFVRPEGRGEQLETELDVNISEPGKCTQPVDLSPRTLQVNEAVRSYVLHFSPETQRVERRAQRVTGAITFDRPILGLIVRHEELLASSGRFGRRGVGEVHQRRELELTGDEAGDRISLSEDRKTVTLDLISPRRSSDLVRVIVDSRGRFQPPTRKNRK